MYILGINFSVAGNMTRTCGSWVWYHIWEKTALSPTTIPHADMNPQTKSKDNIFRFLCLNSGNRLYASIHFIITLEYRDWNCTVKHS